MFSDIKFYYNQAQMITAACQYSKEYAQCSHPECLFLDIIKQTHPNSFPLIVNNKLVAKPEQQVYFQARFQQKINMDRQKIKNNKSLQHQSIDCYQNNAQQQFLLDELYQQGENQRQKQNQKIQQSIQNTTNNKIKAQYSKKQIRPLNSMKTGKQKKMATYSHKKLIEKLKKIKKSRINKKSSLNIIHKLLRSKAQKKYDLNDSFKILLQIIAISAAKQNPSKTIKIQKKQFKKQIINKEEQLQYQEDAQYSQSINRKADQKQMIERIKYKNTFQQVIIQQQKLEINNTQNGVISHKQVQKIKLLQKKHQERTKFNGEKAKQILKNIHQYEKSIQKHKRKLEILQRLMAKSSKVLKQKLQQKKQEQKLQKLKKIVILKIENQIIQDKQCADIQNVLIPEKQDNHQINIKQNASFEQNQAILNNEIFENDAELQINKKQLHQKQSEKDNLSSNFNKQIKKQKEDQKYSQFDKNISHNSYPQNQKNNSKKDHQFMFEPIRYQKNSNSYQRSYNQNPFIKRDYGNEYYVPNQYFLNPYSFQQHGDYQNRNISLNRRCYNQQILQPSWQNKKRNQLNYSKHSQMYYHPYPTPSYSYKNQGNYQQSYLNHIGRDQKIQSNSQVGQVERQQSNFSEQNPLLSSQQNQMRLAALMKYNYFSKVNQERMNFFRQNESFMSQNRMFKYSMQNQSKIRQAFYNKNANQKQIQPKINIQTEKNKTRKIVNNQGNEKKASYKYLSQQGNYEAYSKNQKSNNIYKSSQQKLRKRNNKYQE